MRLWFVMPNHASNIWHSRKPGSRLQAFKRPACVALLLPGASTTAQESAAFLGMKPPAAHPVPVSHKFTVPVAPNSVIAARSRAAMALSSAVKVDPPQIFWDRVSGKVAPKSSCRSHAWEA